MYTLYTVFITIVPILYYKLYLNTVYKYSITIYLYMLPVSLYPKDGKKYMYFRSNFSCNVAMRAAARKLNCPYLEG